MEIVHRQAALCLIRRENAFLVAEIIDPASGLVLHRPPGGGIEHGETPEQAVRRELHEELGVVLNGIRLLATLDHTWHWKGRELRERAWLFLTESLVDERLRRGECPQLLEADGDTFKTFWRPMRNASPALPSLCPSGLSEMMKAIP